MHSNLLRALIITTLFTSSAFALSKTRGTPLGGMGTGYVGFDATKGNFYTSGKAPPAAADGWQGADYNRKPSSSGFYFFADGKAVSKATTTNEDAKCPVYFADFGKTGGVTFILTAFGPYCPGGDPENFKLATSPMALFEIMAINNNTAAVDVAAAMEFANNSNLLGGADRGTVQTGNNAISFAGAQNAYLLVDCDGTTPTFSAGAIGTFTTTGTLANSDGNLVAAKCTVAAGDTVRFKFVLAWWRTYESSTSRYGVSGGDKENYWYHNNFDNSQEVAEFGKVKFDKVRDGITSFVTRTMASNFPEWYKDRLLNNTYPMIHNSQVTKDGRVAFWEGLYGIIGTIDQGQHAALFYTFNWPEVQWKELNYWRSTTRQGSNLGQIHHDFNMGIDNFHSNPEKTQARFICPFDDHDNKDYWWFPDTESWSDLNSMFIFKAYELMLATGNKDSIEAYFPAIKQTAQRIVTQSGSNSIPLNSHSTYDEKVNGVFSFTPEYCGSVALTTYLAVEEIATFLGEDAVAQQYRTLFEKGKKEYKDKFASEIGKTYAHGKDYSEGDVAGYSWANYLCLEPIMDSAFITDASKSLWNFYSKRTESGVDDLRAKLGKWGFYTCDHWGGVDIALGKPDTSMIIHGWDHEYNYKNNPGMIFWQTLRKESSNKNQYASYMTAPTVWRSYFQMIGYLIDNANQRLWVRPRIPTSMNGKITNAILLNPKALGTLNYEETPNTDRTQRITVAYDTPVPIKEFVLKNNTGIDAPSVLINRAAPATVEAEGSSYEKNIRVKYATPVQIGPEGVTIEVYKVQVGNIAELSPTAQIQTALLTTSLVKGKPVNFSVSTMGFVTLDVLSLKGAKIGTIFNGSVSAGKHSFTWSGTTLDGRTLGNQIVILRLTTPADSITRRILVLE